jgi:DNA-directed RNA polymerase specialized sigma24 family protein
MARSEEEIARSLDLPVEEVKAFREEALRILRRALEL